MATLAPLIQPAHTRDWLPIADTLPEGLTQWNRYTQYHDNHAA